MALKIPPQLKDVADQVLNGRERQESVRTLLSWFGAARRSYRNVRQIRKALNKTKLKTDPDFEEAWIDASVAFVPKPKPASKLLSEEVPPTGVSDQEVIGDIGGGPIPKKPL